MLYFCDKFDYCVLFHSTDVEAISVCWAQAEA